MVKKKVKKKKVEDKIKNDFYSFQKKINRLEGIRRELNSLQAKGDTMGLEKEVHILRARLKDVNALPELERNIKNLRSKIMKRKGINKNSNINFKFQLHNRVHQYLEKQKFKQEKQINLKMKGMQRSLGKEHKLYEELKKKLIDKKEKIQALRKRNKFLIENRNKIKSQENLKLQRENRLLIERHKKDMQKLKDRLRKNSNSQNFPPDTILIATGKIKKHWIDFEAYDNGKKGILIHADLIIENNVGSQNAVYVFFYNQDGSAIKTRNPRYSSRDGELMAFSGIITAKYSVSNVADCKIFVPIEEIKTPSGKTQINLVLYLVDLSEGIEKPKVLDKQEHIIAIMN